ncbi:MAG TPA: endo-1,4-beta-xylanase [Chitinophagaceae bacterium]
MCFDKLISKFFWISAATLFGACNGNNSAQSQMTGTDLSLKDAYESFFPIGVSVSGSELVQEGALIKTQFNSITPVNAMKMVNIHPEEHIYNWKEADSIVAFAKRNEMKIRGHTLLWHRQLPDWLFRNPDGTRAPRQLVMQRLKDHITTVVSRYKKQVYAWDVVNEAISDNPNEFYRSDPLFQVCGEEYLDSAFAWAHTADPEAVLFYNDYNEYKPLKRARIIRLITTLRNRGIPVHAAGLQAHWSIYEPSALDLEQTLEDFRSAGIPIQITELDVSIFPKDPRSAAAVQADTSRAFTAEKQKLQSAQYEQVFRLLRKYRQNITGVTFWNITDRRTWLDNFPVHGRKDYPLLFDSNMKPKPAFRKVCRFDD